MNAVVASGERCYRSLMPARYVSAPLQDLLDQSALSAREMDAELERLSAAWQPTILKPGHAYLRQIQERTGIKIVGIARQYRRLLVEIEQHENGKFVWRYHERNGRECLFACAGSVPATCCAALLGEPLRKLILPTAAIGEAIIDTIEPGTDGRMQLTVTPKWLSITA